MEAAKLIILKLTGRCNLACGYCYAAHGEANDMDITTLHSAIERFSKTGDRLKIQFTGGEPLLCSNLIEETAGYTRSRGIRASFSIQTNGTLLHRENCALLKSIGCAVGVSLDGVLSANSLRTYPDGSPAFHDIISGIRMLGAFQMQCNLNAVVTRVNQGRLFEMIDLAAYLGNVRGVGLDMFRPLGRGRDGDYAPLETEMMEDIERMLERAATLNELGADVRIKEAEKVRRMLKHGAAGGPYCDAQTGQSAAIDCRGDVYPCSSFVGMADYRLGNIRVTTGEIPESVHELHSQCTQCGYVALCRGACPAGRAARGGVSDCDCAMHRTFIDHERKRIAHG